MVLRLIALAVACLVATACASDDNEVNPDRESSEGSASETATAVSEEPTPTLPDTGSSGDPVDSDEAQTARVPFPPSRNIVEWSSPLDLGTVSTEFAQDPLALGLPSESELAEILAGRWQVAVGSVARDQVVTTACPDLTTAGELDSAGISVSFVNRVDASLDLTLRRGSEVNLVVDQLVSSVRDCDSGLRVVEDVATNELDLDGRRVVITGDTTVELFEIRNDLLVGAGLSTDAEIDLAESTNQLSKLTTLVFDRLEG